MSIPVEHGGLDPRLSLLKLLAAMAVVVVHTSMVRVSQVDMHSVGWWAANAADAAGRFGSAMFAMVAGAVLLGRPSEFAPWRFVGQRLSRLLPAVVFWSAFYFAWRQWMWGDITWPGMLHDLLMGSPWYHLWFMFMMLGLYVAMPMLRYAIVGVGEGRGWLYFLGVAGAMTWFASIAQTLQRTSHSSFVGLVPFFAVYCWAGYYLLRKRAAVPTLLLWVGAGLAVVFMALGVAWAYPHLQEWAFVLFYSNRSPFAMLLTVCIFLLVLRIPASAIPEWVNRLGAVTLGIYVIHPFWIDMLGRWGWSLQWAGNGWAALACVVFMLSLLSSLALFAIPGARRLVS